MNRAQMVEKAGDALTLNVANFGKVVETDHYLAARVILDAILPQVTTVEELETLLEGATVTPDDLPLLLTVRRGELRNDIWVGTFHQALSELGPLTVVQQP